MNTSSRFVTNVLIINPSDYPYIVKSAQDKKVFPSTRNNLHIIGSCRIYRTTDIEIGKFVIVGF